MIQTLQTHRLPKVLAFMLAVLMAGSVLVSVTGCGNSGGSTTPAAPAVSTNTAPSGMAPPTNTMASPSNGMTATKPGMTNGQKAVVILAGAALLYYLYEKHQAAQKAQMAQGAAGGQQPQLYRSANGGVYYRNPQNPQQVTWLTVPNQPVSVPADQVQQYAPNYQQYQGQPAPQVPAGAAQQSFSTYNGG